MDIINEYLKKHYRNPLENIEGAPSWFKPIPEVTPAVECKDGYRISIQANWSAYCTPRENKAWPYSEVELGFPNRYDELIDEFAEVPDEIEKTVYGYVPIDIVVELINKHGGIKEE